MYKNWGKTKQSSKEIPAEYHLLVYHCLDVAATGNCLLKTDTKLLKKFSSLIGCDEKSTLSLITFFLSIHDVGKFSEHFQNLQPSLQKELRGSSSSKDYLMRHDSMGFLLWKDLWNSIWENNYFHLDKENYDQYDWMCVFEPWVQAVTGHHGKPPVSSVHGVSVSANSFFSAEEMQMVLSFVKEVSTLFIDSDFSINLNERCNTIDPIDFLIEAFSKSSWLLAGLTVLSDWVGSDSDHFAYIDYDAEPISLKKYWYTNALPEAENALKDFGILPSLVSCKTGMAVLFPHLTNPTPLQSYVSDCPIHSQPQLFIMEETTGSGKTEAALTLSHRMMEKELANGVYIALPTMATSNAMYGRMKGAYKKMFAEGSNASLVLAHGGRHLSDSFRQSIGFTGSKESENYIPNKSKQNEETVSAQCNIWIADNKKKSLLADVGVGTIDQALMSILPFNHQSLRILGLTRNCLIVDEVHAYDPYINTLLCTLLKFHASSGGSAVLLSATLSMHQRQQLINSYCEGLGVQSQRVHMKKYPQITHCSGKGFSETAISLYPATARKIEIEFFTNFAEAESKIIEVSAAGYCACWIRNTVDDAIESYESLVSRLGDEKVILFHARFAMGDRLSIEDKVLNIFGKESDSIVRKEMVLVATQVVEQSLDLDFDYMVTDLAPIDLLIQRAGRLQRHQLKIDRGCPTLGIISPEPEENPTSQWYSDFFPKAAYVYPCHGQLWLTASILARKGKINIPEDIRELIEGVFGREAYDKIPEELRDIENKALGDKMAEISLAHINHLNLERGYTKSGTSWIDDTLAPTRLGEPTTNVRLAKWDGEKLTPWYGILDNPWDMSEVSVNQNKINSPIKYDIKLETAIEEAKLKMLDKGKWCIVVPLSSEDGIEWRGYAKNIKEETVIITYSRTKGLTVNKMSEALS
jgi:CRISPR-associated endonuclease/helicase Cas3